VVIGFLWILRYGFLDQFNAILTFGSVISRLGLGEQGLLDYAWHVGFSAGGLRSLISSWLPLLVGFTFSNFVR
jgi:hypothetical protein